MIETAEKLNNQAIMLAADGSFTEAIACFARAITIEKDNALLWYNLGITYRDAGKLDEAKDSLIKAYQIAPEDSDIVQELAVMLLNLGDLDTALAYCEKGLFDNPEDTHLWNTRGVILFNKGLYTEASDSFENAVILNPYYADALFNLRDTYEKLGNKAGYAECNAKLRELKNKDF